MKRTLRVVALALTLAVSALTITSCGTPAGDAATNWFNSPQTQQELGQIQQTAFSILLGYLSGFKGGTTHVTTSSPRIQSKVEELTAKFKAEHPNVPEATIRETVKKAAADAIARKQATG